MPAGSTRACAPSARQQDTSEDIWQHIRQDLSAVLGILEGRFLFLIREGGGGAIPPEAVAGELSLLLRDLKASFRRLVEMEGRRDLSFKTTNELHEIDQHCVWLFREIRAQQTFLRKLSLEASLRRLVSPEAFSIYQTLLGLDDEEREAQSTDDAKTRTLILKE
jgi:hypothetical protein